MLPGSRVCTTPEWLKIVSNCTLEHTLLVARTSPTRWRHRVASCGYVDTTCNGCQSGILRCRRSRESVGPRGRQSARHAGRDGPRLSPRVPPCWTAPGRHLVRTWCCALCLYGLFRCAEYGSPLCVRVCVFTVRTLHGGYGTWRPKWSCCIRKAIPALFTA